MLLANRRGCVRATGAVLAVLILAVCDGAVWKVLRAQAPIALLGIVWDKTFGADTTFAEFRAASPASDDGVLVGVSQRDAIEAAASKTSRVFVWRIDAAGQLRSETELREPGESRATNTAAIRDLTLLPSGETLALVDFEGGRPSIVRLDRAGKQIATRSILAAGRSATLFEMVPAPAGRFLLIGHDSFDALRLLISEAGDVIWEKTEDHGQMDFFVDGIQGPGGTFVLVGNSGKYDPVRSGPSSVWLGRYDLQGNRTADVKFPGRYGRIAQLERGYALVYDQGASHDQDVHVKLLDDDLKEISDTPLFQAAKNFSDFKIAALPNGEIVVGGGKAGRLFMTVIDGKGREVTTLQGEPRDRSVDIGNFGLVRLGGGQLILASSHITAIAKGNVQQKVRVRRVSP